MIGLTQGTYLIIYFIKTFMMNISIYYSCNKLMHKPIKESKWLVFIIVNLILTVVGAVSREFTNDMLLLVLTICLQGIIVSILGNNKYGHSLIVVLLSYAICNVILLLATIISYMCYATICNGNEIFGTVANTTTQFILVVLFYKIKRFKNGLGFLNKKLSNDGINMIVIYISVCIVLIACMLGNLFAPQEETIVNTFITFIILGITMYVMIQRTLTMHYKHTLLLKTLDEYKQEIDAKDKEIEKFNLEKFNTSKIRHEFFNRQKALELIIKQNMSSENIEGLDNESVLKVVNELTNEYSKECEIIKGTATLPKTDVVEIDSMFRYMQMECAKNNIEFKLNIQDAIHPLINSSITKSRLETLLGDHIRDAINAVNKSKGNNKEILVVLGLKDGNYEICILDNGVEFGIDTLLKLGKEQVTTGGTGIGFLTTFETLRETKASLVITEFKESIYTKSVAVVFNNKCEYVVNSYRAKDIKEKCYREDIIINEIKG